MKIKCHVCGKKFSNFLLRALKKKQIIIKNGEKLRLSNMQFCSKKCLLKGSLR